MHKKSYDVLAWVPHLLLFYKEKVFRKLMPIMLIITAYGILSSLIFPYISRLNLGQFHLIFSFTLTIIISFRVNSSYDRWWEGRTLWGSIVNNSRNLALKFDAYFGLEKNIEFYQLVYILPIMIKANLRKDRDIINQQLKTVGLELSDTAHPVVFVSQKLYFIINSYRDGSLERMQQCALLDLHVANLIDMVGACERIANTKMPPAFAFFVKQALLFYTIMFPFGWLDTFGILIIPMMLIIVYILLGLEILSEELEDPFNICDNGLNLDAICKTIQTNLEQIKVDTIKK